MKEIYKYVYNDHLPKHVGGIKSKAIVKCKNKEVYLIELRDMMNALRRELDKYDRKRKGKNEK